MDEEAVPAHNQPLGPLQLGQDRDVLRRVRLPLQRLSSAFTVWVSLLIVYGLSFIIQEGFKLQVQEGFRLKVQESSGFRVQGSGFRV